MPRATLLTTRTPTILWDWRQEKGRILAAQRAVAHSHGSNMFASYTAKTNQLTQTRSNNNYYFGTPSACICLIRRQQRSRWGFPKENSAKCK